MRTAACLLAVLIVSLQAQTPGPVPAAPLPPQMSPAVQTCVPCHGTSGEGKPSAGFPRIAAQSQHYIRKQLDSYADGTRRDPVMQAVARGLPAALRAEAAAYYAAADAPFIRGASAFTQGWQERGRKLATEGDSARRVQACANCHGPDGTGQPPALPYLAGLHDGYIRSTLMAWQAGTRRNDAGQQMAVIASALGPEDIAAVARYYAGLTPPEPAPPDREQSPSPQLMAAGTTPSIIVGTDTRQEAGAGIESRDPMTGGEPGSTSNGAESPGGVDERGPGSSGAPARGTRTPAAAGPSVGDASRGRAIIVSGAHGCTACHVIPGITAPSGIAGPRLAGFARRPFIAGQLPNRHDVLVAFLRDSPALVPRTAMPKLGLSLEEAHHIAAYLYTMNQENGP